MLSPAVLQLDAEAEIARIVRTLRQQVLGSLRKRGAVVGLSGGVDSSVVAALCARALGSDKVLGIFMPERDSSPDSLRLGRLVADTLGIEAVVEDVTAALEGFGCYRRQAEAVQSLVPEYGDGWKCKLSLPSPIHGERLNVSRLTVEDPAGETRSVRLTAQAYLKLVAATNFKQRVRKTIEYYHADRLNYAVTGTPNRLEFDQGFFVKQGDGAADVKPIAHLYKTQVYQLARHLGVPEEIRARAPTTDTFSMSQTQEEFYFALPYAGMDLCLYAHNHGVEAAEVAAALSLEPEQVERVFRDIDSKRNATHGLHAAALLVEEIAEIDRAHLDPQR
ncbi:MAG TPA: NAD(+) synthase [Burkholderiales bacterium]|nr:NAD(+) synthase [Burkholderiales bacterium]